MDKDLRIVLAIKKLKESIDKLSTENNSNSAEIDNINRQIDTLTEEISKSSTEAKSESDELKTALKEVQKDLEKKINTIQLTPGPKGADGRDGRDGKDGARGERGLPGKNGIDGKDGKDGIGIPGINGRDGIDGTDGKDGISITDATIDKNGHLIIEFSNGEKKDVGNVLGANGVSVRGPQGVSVKEVEIRDNHLYVKLSNGVEIDAGAVSGGGVGEETDPIFTSSPAYDITANDISNWNSKSDFSGDYNDLDNKPTIPVVPTYVSAFTNDAGYLTEHQSLNGYATETWVQSQGYLTSHQDISGKYDKTGGEITGNVKIDGTLTLDIEDEDYDAGITFTKELNTNLGTVLTLTGYADNTTYRPIIRNVGTPQNNYDVANKKYVDDNIVRPLSYFVFLNADGTIDMYSSQLDYSTVKSNLTNLTTTVYLDVIQGQSRFYVSAIQDMDVNNGPIKFIGIYNKDGNKCLIEFNLYSDNTLTVEITLLESLWNKTQDVSNNSTNTVLYPSAKAVYDFVMDFVKPHVVWESSTPSEYLKGISANLTASPAWQLTNLDLTPYKRIKIYSKAGQGTGTTANASTTASMILEMTLDERSAIAEIGGHYVASTLSQKPNDNNRLATLTCAVSSDKTSFVVLRQTNLYGTGATQNNDVNANVFLIEGYYY